MEGNTGKKRGKREENKKGKISKREWERESNNGGSGGREERGGERGGREEGRGERGGGEEGGGERGV